MIPRFALSRPTSLDAALDAFAKGHGDVAYLAGGTELLQVMKMGFAQFGRLVDLKRIEELHGIVASDGGLHIGAATTHREIERSTAAGKAFPALVALEQGVANSRVRSTGTLGGNLAFAEPHSDPATLLLACAASVELAGSGGRRRLSISEFIVGPLATSREPDEILTAISIPARAPGEGRAYAKFAFFERPAASVAVRLAVRDGAIDRADVAVGSLTDLPMIVPDAGLAFVGTAAAAGALPAAVLAARAAFDGLEIGADLNGSADYKRHLAGVLLASTARDALAEAIAGA